jgi:hypothetical protein
MWRLRRGFWAVASTVMIAPMEEGGMVWEDAAPAAAIPA